MDVCIIGLAYYTDVHASGHGFYTVQSRNEAYTKQCKIAKKIYGQTKGGGAPPPTPHLKYATDWDHPNGGVECKGV